jgi:hypothetical protein
VELVYTLVLGTSAERLVGSSPTLRTNILIMIPYELMKIYRDIGIDLSGFTPMYLFGESYENHFDSFLYNAF